MPRQQKLTCPHCGLAGVATANYFDIHRDDEGVWHVLRFACPGCDRLVLYLVEGEVTSWAPGSRPSVVSERSRRLLHPRSSGRSLAPEVPDEYKRLYTKAALILDDAPEASAALSRRCLQQVLEGPGGATKRDLIDQIDELAPALPTWVSEPLHALRIIGNFAAHPIKSTATATVLDVQPGEAEWSLDTLDAVFDYYFVQPAKEAARKKAINAKLQQAGREPI